MRNFARIGLLGIILFICTAFTTMGRSVIAVKPLEIFSKEVIEVKPKITVDIPKITAVKSTELFLNAIGRRESSNRYWVVNSYGYMGKYQFGRKTLDKLGFKHISNKEFLSNPEIQEQAMRALLKQNRKTLRRQISSYKNSIHHNVYITESGLLAAAHLAGAGNVKKWLRSGRDFRDGYGTSIKEYLTLFGNYQISL